MYTLFQWSLVVAGDHEHRELATGVTIDKEECPRLRELGAFGHQRRQARVAFGESGGCGNDAAAGGHFGLILFCYLNINKFHMNNNKLYIDQRRLESAILQRIFVIGKKVLNGSVADPQVELTITGTTGRTYYVQVDQRHYSCSCPDFQTRGARVGPCKHILNVLVKVLKIPPHQVLTGKADLGAFLPALVKMQAVGPGGASGAIQNVRGDTDCPICYEDLRSAKEEQSSCDECLHLFHRGCVAIWLRTNQSCPLCRGFMSCQTPVASPVMWRLVDDEI